MAIRLGGASFKFRRISVDLYKLHINPALTWFNQLPVLVIKGPASQLIFGFSLSVWSPGFYPGNIPTFTIIQG